MLEDDSHKHLSNTISSRLTTPEGVSPCQQTLQPKEA